MLEVAHRARAVAAQLPQPLWCRDPLHAAAVRLLARDVQGLAAVEGAPQSGRNAPLCLPACFGAGAGRVLGAVGVQGVVVEVVERTKFLAAELDDGTGVVPVVVWAPDQDGGDSALSAERYQRARRRAQLGALLSAAGRPSEYRGRVQIVAEDLTDEGQRGGANAEADWWVDCLLKRVELYERPASDFVDVGGGG